MVHGRGRVVSISVVVAPQRVCARRAGGRAQLVAMGLALHGAGAGVCVYVRVYVWLYIWPSRAGADSETAVRASPVDRCRAGGVAPRINANGAGMRCWAQKEPLSFGFQRSWSTVWVWLGVVSKQGQVWSGRPPRQRGDAQRLVGRAGEIRQTLCQK